MDIFPKSAGRGRNVVTFLERRELHGESHDKHAFPPSVFTGLCLTSKVLGHCNGVYFVKFDKTGNYFLTASNDTLVKIWSASNGRLLFTFRGSRDIIVDITINNENSIVAAASQDGYVWIWSLENGALVKNTCPHDKMMTSIAFSPTSLINETKGYLFSTSFDGTIAISCYTVDENKDIIFNKRTTVFKQVEEVDQHELDCAALSPGGMFYVTGGQGNTVNLYYTGVDDELQQVYQDKIHPSNVQCISWANNSFAFITGGEKSAVFIRRFWNSTWSITKLDCHNAVIGDSKSVPSGCGDTKHILQVVWSKDDSYVCAALSDNTVCIWLPFYNSHVVRKLTWHTKIVSAIQSHPIDGSILCTAGEDGKLAIWNVTTKGILSNDIELLFEYQPDETNKSAINDCKWSPDGLSLVAVDAHGHIMIFTRTMKKSSKFAGLPQQMLFNTDFISLMPTGQVGNWIDTSVFMPPHLMSPPWLVYRNGYLQPMDVQNLVPGREQMSPEEMSNDYDVVAQDSTRVHFGQNYHRLIIPKLKESVYKAAENVRLVRSNFEKSIYDVIKKAFEITRTTPDEFA